MIMGGTGMTDPTFLNPRHIIGPGLQQLPELTAMPFILTNRMSTTGKQRSPVGFLILPLSAVAEPDLINNKFSCFLFDDQLSSVAEPCPIGGLKIV